MNSVEYLPDWFSPDDLHWFHEGTHYRLYQKWGAHLTSYQGKTGVHFAVWAPNARQVSVTGEFNQWDIFSHPLQPTGQSGIWSGFIPGLSPGTPYQYQILSRQREYRVDKADPVGFRSQCPPSTASMVWDLSYPWHDSLWMAERRERQKLTSPISIYEVHLGSWRRVPEEGNRFLTYAEAAPHLVEYLARMGFTHVGLLPVMQHADCGSWGFQTTGYYAPAAQYGTPQDLMYLVDYLHQHSFGVILDWVPMYFSAEKSGLAFFDGTPLYETSIIDPGGAPPEKCCSFDLHRPEVLSFLLSNALFWLDRYHADGLRVGGVAALLPPRESMESSAGHKKQALLAFLRRFNAIVQHYYPTALTIAEEGCGWPLVSRSTGMGGLGFGLKWDTDFARNTLHYFSQDPFFRKQHHHALTGRIQYAFTENFILPLSHETVRPGWGSLLQKMPGDEWQKFANLRLLLACLFLQPGKKLLFMGAEFGQRNEWHPETSLDWHLLQFAPHAQLQQFVNDLNHLYHQHPALHELDTTAEGFSWVDNQDAEQSTLSWLRHSSQPGETVLVVCNFTPVPRHNFRVGAPQGGTWREILNSDATVYGGSGHGNLGAVEAAPFAWHVRPFLLNLTLPPLAAVVFQPLGS